MGLLDPTERITHNLVLDTTAHAEAWAVCFLEDIVNKRSQPDYAQGIETLNGAQLYFEIHGVGEPLVLLLGLLGFEQTGCN